MYLLIENVSEDECSGDSAMFGVDAFMIPTSMVCRNLVFLVHGA
jgi:hypothetical protein